MADTKLSNINGFEKLYREVPYKVDQYTEDSREEINEIRENSRYASDVSPLGMIICAALMLLGAFLAIKGIKVFPAEIKTGMTIGAVVVMIIGFHGICRMIYGMQLNSCDKKLTKAGDIFKKQYYAADNPTNSAKALMEAIASGEDREIKEESTLAQKLEKAYTNVTKVDRWTSLLVLISRITIPVILFAMAVYCTRQGLVMISFIIMFIFCRRLCLLLEYKVNKWIRAVMCIPSLLYGWLVYKWADFGGPGIRYMLADDLMAKVPEAAQIFCSKAFVLAIAQTICLILAVCLMNYYGEREFLSKGLERKGRKPVKKWGIYLRVTGYITLMLMYIFMLAYCFAEPQYTDTTLHRVLLAVVFGAVWRIISPIWPKAMEKVTCKYWTIAYSLVLEAFFVIVMLTLVFNGGFVFQLSSAITIGVAVLASWVVFAIMQHFWG